jgi:membrane protein implicated in regulation of membrane protease activity
MKLSYEFSRETSVFEKHVFSNPLHLLFLSDG